MMEHDDYLMLIRELVRLAVRQSKFIDHITAQLRAYTLRELGQKGDKDERDNK